MARETVYAMTRNLACQLRGKVVTLCVGMRGDAGQVKGEVAKCSKNYFQGVTHDLSRRNCSVRTYVTLGVAHFVKRS